MTDRDSEIHNWRVLMVQQATFWRRDNKTRNFAFTLLEWAGNARRRALESDGVPDRGDAGSSCRGWIVIIALSDLALIYAGFAVWMVREVWRGS